MARHQALAIASAAALFLLAPSRAHAQGTTKLDLQGPGTVYEGEQAVFYSRLNEKSATWSELECVATDAQGRSVASFTGEHAFAAGDYEVHVTSPGFVSPTVSLRVKALPPFVSPSAPLSQRLANIEIYVWNGDRSLGGRILEKLGGFIGPKVVGAHYAVTWCLAGRQASRANVDYAISELARRGYVIDMYSAAHGYPILLGDQSLWTDPGSNPDLKAVRLFYATACNGADGKDEFLAAGVKTYVAATGENFVNVGHALLFVHDMAEGETVDQANTDANASLERLAHLPLVNWVARELEKKFADGDGTTSGFDKDLIASLPHVYGDTKLTFKTDPGATVVAAKEPPARGIVQALQAMSAP